MMMTTATNEDHKELQQDVQRLLGRCMLRLQQYERLIKALVAHQQVSGPMDAFEAAQAKQVDRTAGKTLGTLVGAFLGSYFVADDATPPDPPGNSDETPSDWASLKMSCVMPEAEIAAVETGLKELVSLRNDLVHHFIDQHDIFSPDGCRSAQTALIAAYSRIDGHFHQLADWADRMTETQRMLVTYTQTERFKEALEHVFEDENNVSHSPLDVETALREAFAALAVDGWASVTDAGKWITEIYPEQNPARHGCSSWRQVVHVSASFEIRYRTVNGHNIACYREKQRLQ